MSDATTSGDMLPGLSKVAERAKRNPTERILALARFIDVPALARSFNRLRKDAAVGVDGVTVEGYGQRLEENLQALHERMKAGQYRHQPIRRVYIPKENGKERPIGVSTVEDKVVQGAIREVLEAVYEQDFLECSKGFRPERSAHDAIRAVDREVRRGSMKFILEADFVSFFDSIVRRMLMEMLRERIADESLLRLVGKCLHVGILEGTEYTEPDLGAAQGSALSPLLGNIYLHHVLDVWFEREVKPRMKGQCVLVRYADDFVLGFERKDDAEQVENALRERVAKYGLTLHAEKTRLFEFRPPKDGGGNKGTVTFDFLGFTLYWQKTRRGSWRMGCKTRRARLRRFVSNVTDWCRRHRHRAVEEQHVTLTRKLKGHFAYYGVSGNLSSLAKVVVETTKAWQKWLNRRSQRARMTWERFEEVLKKYPLPNPRISVQIWG
ncbi:MAG: group II intron reverse transcriptase/maturase [Deltaproteobacteria bacterium]|nr:group II intron reverse transcriptase/maturase [Deltaproteobacteria bacterium]